MYLWHSQAVGVLGVSEVFMGSNYDNNITCLALKLSRWFWQGEKNCCCGVLVTTRTGKNGFGIHEVKYVSVRRREHQIVPDKVVACLVVVPLLIE